MDFIDGKFIGFVRILFGYMFNFLDVKEFLIFIRECFLEGNLSRFLFERFLDVERFEYIEFFFSFILVK